MAAATLLADCDRCGEPVTGQPVCDPEAAQWLGRGNVAEFCSDSCMGDDSADRASAAHDAQRGDGHAE